MAMPEQVPERGPAIDGGDDIAALIERIGRQAKTAAQRLSLASTETKNAALAAARVPGGAKLKAVLEVKGGGKGGAGGTAEAP